METYFAPAKRTDRRKFKNQIADISHNPIMNTLLESAAGLLIVLNEDRQIVAINHAFLKASGIKNIDDVLGFRLGECLHCAHAFDKPNGCGTTEACVSCGAAIAMMTAIVDDKPDEKICALVTDEDNVTKNLCLLIQAKPIVSQGSRWILIYAKDVTKEHFWMNMEKVFFHDINNVLTTVFGNIQLLQTQYPDNTEIENTLLGCERLIQEIRLQKAYSENRQEGFRVHRQRIPIRRIETDLRLMIGQHRAIKDIIFLQNWPKAAIDIETDPLLVSRVIGNMVINACEASQTGDSVRLDATVSENDICFNVWNNSEIDPKIRPRIFQKHFSTKFGPGRGLGTYSMKLLGEQFLGGQISFSTGESTGTTFSFCLPL